MIERLGVCDGRQNGEDEKESGCGRFKMKRGGDGVCLSRRRGSSPAAADRKFGRNTASAIGDVGEEEGCG
ncbi:hypothetical protein Hanom_Chr00s199725g01837571 [Helianthus anomalus]